MSSVSKLLDDFEVVPTARGGKIPDKPVKIDPNHNYPARSLIDQLLRWLKFYRHRRQVQPVMRTGRHRVNPNLTRKAKVTVDAIEVVAGLILKKLKSKQRQDAKDLLRLHKLSADKGEVMVFLRTHDFIPVSFLPNPPQKLPATKGLVDTQGDARTRFNGVLQAFNIEVDVGDFYVSGGQDKVALIHASGSATHHSSAVTINEYDWEGVSEMALLCSGIEPNPGPPKGKRIKKPRAKEAVQVAVAQVVEAIDLTKDLRDELNQVKATLGEKEQALEKFEKRFSKRQTHVRDTVHNVAFETRPGDVYTPLTKVLYRPRIWNRMKIAASIIAVNVIATISVHFLGIWGAMALSAALLPLFLSMSYRHGAHQEEDVERDEHVVTVVRDPTLDWEGDQRAGHHLAGDTTSSSDMCRLTWRRDHWRRPRTWLERLQVWWKGHVTVRDRQETLYHELAFNRRLVDEIYEGCIKQERDDVAKFFRLAQRAYHVDTSVEHDKTDILPYLTMRWCEGQRTHSVLIRCLNGGAQQLSGDC
jgi:hypothetical protein